VPTFRGNGGLWKQYRAEELATPQAFARDPKLVWEWYDWRRSMIAKAEPNAGHFALAALERQTPSFTLITQNVDGLHDRASSRNILKVHGDIWNVRCLSCGRETLDTRVPLPELPPHCQCGGHLRPGVVWFGENLPQATWKDAEKAARSCEIFLVIGTSAVVYPAAGLIHLAQAHGATVIEINVEPSAVSHHIDAFLQGASGELLPQLIA
jgi:NAD-dependent deacetylase